MRVVLLVTLLLVLFPSCFHRAGEITLVSEFEPLTVKVNPGNDLAHSIWFQGPFRNELVNGPEPPPRNDSNDIIVWRIKLALNDKHHEAAPVDRTPIVTYGRVPEGWEQEFPSTGSPRPLLDGYVYAVSAIPFDGPRPKDLCVLVNKGRLQPYTKPGRDVLCTRGE